MRIKRFIDRGKREKNITLGNCVSGQVFRFPNASFEQAFSKEDDDFKGFFMVVKECVKIEDASIVLAFSLKNNVLHNLDSALSVIPHDSELWIDQAEMVDVD